MSEKKTYVLYGASFNPPHKGHFSAISQMLEEFDYVIIFLYPKKHNNISGEVEILPPLKQRGRMLDLFIKEHFPNAEIQDKLIITNLAEDIGPPKNGEKVLHTYDYLQFVKENLPETAVLHACMSFNEGNQERAERFYNESKIKDEFGVFYLQEENHIQSSILRDFFSNNKSIKSVKDMNYIKYAVGNNLADYIFKNNLYGLKDRVKKSKEVKVEDVESNVNKDNENITSVDLNSETQLSLEKTLKSRKIGK